LPLGIEEVDLPSNSINIKNEEMGRACRSNVNYEVITNCGGNPERERPIGKPWRSWADKTDREKM
jgi:hypothetical protein